MAEFVGSSIGVGKSKMTGEETVVSKPKLKPNQQWNGRIRVIYNRVIYFIVTTFKYFSTFLLRTKEFYECPLRFTSIYLQAEWGRRYPKMGRAQVSWLLTTDYTFSSSLKRICSRISPRWTCVFIWPATTGEQWDDVRARLIQDEFIF